MTARQPPDTTSTEPEQRTLAIGLTGGIGSGKSTVAEGFRALGVPVIDADILARELVEPGQPALADIHAQFGSDFFHADGSLDRDAMRRHIYTSPADRTRLEAILHPRIRSRIRVLLRESRAPYSLVVIPLLVETGQADLVDRILVVDAPTKEQRKRVAARDGLSDNAISAIMAAQADREARLDAADDIITNDADLASLDEQVGQLHRRYMDMTDEH